MILTGDGSVINTDHIVHIETKKFNCRHIVHLVNGMEIEITEFTRRRIVESSAENN